MPYDQGTSDYSVDAGRLQDAGPPSAGRSPDLGLGRLVRLVKRGGDLVYASEGGLSGFEWRLLSDVCDAPGQSINDLGKQSDRSVAQVSRTIKHLMELGLVERRPVPGGHRVAIHPTSMGREQSRGVTCASIDLKQTLTAGISDLDLAVFERVVSVMTRNAARAAQGEAERS